MGGSPSAGSAGVCILQQHVQSQGGVRKVDARRGAEQLAVLRCLIPTAWWVMMAENNMAWVCTVLTCSNRLLLCELHGAGRLTAIELPAKNKKKGSDAGKRCSGTRKTGRCVTADLILYYAALHNCTRAPTFYQLACTHARSLIHRLNGLVARSLACVWLNQLQPQG